MEHPFWVSFDGLTHTFRLHTCVCVGWTIYQIDCALYKWINRNWFWFYLLNAIWNFFSLFHIIYQSVLLLVVIKLKFQWDFHNVLVVEIFLQTEYISKFEAWCVTIQFTLFCSTDMVKVEKDWLAQSSVFSPKDYLSG